MKRKTFLMIINILLEIVLYLHSTIITKSYYINTSVKIYRTKKLNNGSRVTGSAI